MKSKKKIIHKKNVFVYFNDADPQGILFFSKPYDFAHEALEEFWAQHNLGWDYWFKNSEFAVPIRHTSCEHLKPLLVGRSYQAQLSVHEISETSISFHFELQDGPAICALVQTVHVFVNRKTFKKMPVPQNIRLLLTI